MQPNSLHLLRALPNGVGTGCRQQLRWFFGLAATEAELASTGDVFPLPLSLSAEDEALVSLAAQPGALEQVPVKQQVTAGKRVWLLRVILALNLLHFAFQNLDRRQVSRGLPIHQGTVNAAQIEAGRRLREQVDNSLELPMGEADDVAEGNFVELLASRGGLDMMAG